MALIKMNSRADDIWVIRIYTQDHRFRLQLYPTDLYQKVIEFICQKTDCTQKQIQIYSPNGRKLNIAPQRRIKDVVYLSHGSILNVKILKQIINSAMKERASFLSADSKFSRKTQHTPNKDKCNHADNVHCIHCLEGDKKLDVFKGTGQLIWEEVPKEETGKCNHDSRVKCFKCAGRDVRSAGKQKERQIIKLRSPKKRNNPQSPVRVCKHRPTITCKNCIDSPSRIKKISIVQEPSSLKVSKQVKVEQKKEDKKQEKMQRKCKHGQNAKCINCLEIPKDKKKETIKGVCNHEPQGKCINCLAEKQKAAHLAFDEYLSLRRANCHHKTENHCLNCLPPTNLRLTLDKTCKNHPPYPEALCSSCQPQSLTIKAQPYRHVDYVQFMNGDQVQNFINFWLSQKKNHMRVGFLYGYFCEDPFYKNGIRAIVEAIYQPHQYCTESEFWILDCQKRRYNLLRVSEGLHLERIGIIMATTNTGECPLTEGQIRVMARIQARESVKHSSGYMLSNFFSVVVRKSKDVNKAIQPQVFMVSDQGQAMETANMFVTREGHSYKMKLKEEKDMVEFRPSVYVGGKESTQFQIEYLLVKVAAGLSPSNKFAILKSNTFPPSSRGPIKTHQMKQYIAKTKNQSGLIRLGDLNLLLFVAQVIDPETALQIGVSISQFKQIDQDVCTLVQQALQKLIV